MKEIKEVKNAAYDLSGDNQWNQLDNRKWTDIVPFNFCDSDGYLTEDCKSFMRANKLRTLDEALDFIERHGYGYFYN